MACPTRLGPLAPILFGVISTAGCLVYFRVDGIAVIFTPGDVEVAYVLPLLLGCGFAGAMLLVGGADPTLKEAQV